MIFLKQNSKYCGPILQQRRGTFEQEIDRCRNVIITFVERHQSFILILVRHNLQNLDHFNFKLYFIKILIEIHEQMRRKFRKLSLFNFQILLFLSTFYFQSLRSETKHFQPLICLFIFHFFRVLQCLSKLYLFDFFVYFRIVTLAIYQTCQSHLFGRRFL